MSNEWNKPMLQDYPDGFEGVTEFVIDTNLYINSLESEVERLQSELARCKSERSIQPTPKSAEEVLREIVPKDCIWEYMNNFTNVPMSYILEAMQNYASQFARYVPDEEIDAMWPIDESDRSNPVYFVAIAKRNGAKSVRDMIFGGVKQ